jgi:Ca2+-binding EF-hand superfamily protein
MSRDTPPNISPRTLEVFRKIDDDGSGYIGHRGLRDALRAYGFEVSAEMAKSVLDRYDDGNRKLDVNEARPPTEPGTFCVCAPLR